MGGMRRIVRLLVCLGLVLSLNFLLPRLMPGDPVAMLLGPDAVSLSKKDHAALKAEYGLDHPLGEQYLAYGADLLRGNLGYSFHHHQPVSLLIRDHLSRSVLLLAPALLLSTLAAAFLGTLAGWKRGTATDRGITFFAVLLFAMPSFLTAMILLDLFGYRLEWFPLGGFFPGFKSNPAFTDSLKTFFRYLTLPTCVLALTSVGAKYMVMRNAVAAAGAEDYVLYARAKGVSPWKIAFVHIFKNACLPLLHLVALHMGFLVSGAILVEIVFSINGMGILIFDAAMNRDYPVLQGSFFVLTLVVMGLNLLVDLVAGLIDPRIRLGRTA
jgi:peptide/nickel transport system permease protein